MEQLQSQRRRSNLSGRTGTSAMVHASPSPTFPVKLFCRSIFLVLAFFCILFYLLFILKLPSVSDNDSAVYLNPRRLNKHFFSHGNFGAARDRAALGFLGEKMVGMLPDDLPFTVFVPSEQYFRRILGREFDVVQGNFTEKMSFNSTSDNTVAIISRILGFSTAPLHLPSKSVPLNGEVEMESLSGFRLQVVRFSDGVYVNNMTCDVTDLRRGQTILHVVRGVIMDAEFQQSVRPDDNDLE